MPAAVELKTGVEILAIPLAVSGHNISFHTTT